MRFSRLAGLGCTLALGALVSCSRPRTSSNQPATQDLRPFNVVLVTIDTLRPDHLHCYGYSKIETPTLDSLATSGALFENAVTQTPLTPPSHASIFTGLYPTVHHVRDTGGFILGPSTTLATILHQQGWDTAAFVSSAVLKKQFGFSQGFNVYDDQMPKPSNIRDVVEDPERRAGDTVDRAIHWLDAQSGRPYFLWVHLYDPHQPYQPPSPFKEKYKDRAYDGEIAYADRELGRLFEAVHNKKSPAEKTMVAVMSDHGESLREHGEYTHGVFLYDATLRIAFLMSGPGVPAGVRVKQQARTVDFLPTILELMGGQAPPSIQGASLLPSFTGSETPTAVSYAETLYPKINMGWAELRAIRTNHWKYVRAPKPELYDLSLDPAETTNVIQTHAVERERFEAQLKAVVGGDGTEKVGTSSIDQHTLDQLRSLGYVSGSSVRTFSLTGQGADPKDRVGILKLVMQAEDPAAHTPDSRRIELLQQAVKEDPGDPDLYYQLGAKYEKAGRHSEAIQLYREAIGKGIEDARLHSRIGDLMLRAGKKDEAIPEYEKAASMNPADTASQTNLAVAYLELGRVPDAERVFHWVIATDPQSAAAFNGLGLISIQKSDPGSARGYFEKAVQIDPDLIEAQLNLGLIYRMAGESAKARGCFEAFLAKAPPAQYGEMIPKVREALTELR
jgi:choline-sulfatase